MARSDQALRLRVPSRARHGSGDSAARERERRHRDRPPLRLVVTKGRLGVELEEPYGLGPLRVGELAVSFPDVQFPVELSGGVRAFRHRRGQLERLRVELAGEEVARWGAVRLRRVTEDPATRLVAAPLEDGWLVGLTWGRSALAFEVLVAPLDGDLRLLPIDARGLGLSAPAQAMAARALAALLHPVGKLVGGAVLVEDAAAQITRALLPLCGMRAPSGDGVRWGAPELSLPGVALGASSGQAPPELGERVVRAIELAQLACSAEESLLAGNLDAARRAYLGALEQAPRHPELSRRVAEVDDCAGERAEAALGLLAEATMAVDSGVLGARLLAEVGDRDGAVAAFRRAATGEPFGPLAALAWLEVARLAADRAERREALDRAVSRAPALDLVRLRRLEERVRAGDLRGIQEDAAHLEAQASGSAARHEVALQVAGLLFAQDLVPEAAEWYERALRYLPDSTEAVAGLARSLRAVGRPRRALDLLGRAVALAERSRQPAHAVVIDLAKALVEVADDRPAAIAQTRRVPPFVPETFEARLLEARWRADLGDLAGADVALGKLAEAVEQAQGVLLQQGPPAAEPCWGEGSPWPTPVDARAAIGAMLAEGAELQQLERLDLRAAQRLAELGIRLRPHDRRLLAIYRKLCRELQPAAAPESVPSSPEQPPPSASAPSPAAPVELDGQAEMGGDDELLIERLSERLRADPENRETVERLIELLERAGRDHDLLALLSARIDDGPEEVRAALSARRQVVLERLLWTAQQAGNDAEAELYALMLERSEH